MKAKKYLFIIILFVLSFQKISAIPTWEEFNSVFYESYQEAARKSKNIEIYDVNFFLEYNDIKFFLNHAINYSLERRKEYGNDHTYFDHCLKTFGFFIYSHLGKTYVVYCEKEVRNFLRTKFACADEGVFLKYFHIKLNPKDEQYYGYVIKEISFSDQKIFKSPLFDYLNNLLINLTVPDFEKFKDEFILSCPLYVGTTPEKIFLEVLNYLSLRKNNFLNESQYYNFTMNFFGFFPFNHYKKNYILYNDKKMINFFEYMNFSTDLEYLSFMRNKNLGNFNGNILIEINLQKEYNFFTHELFCAIKKFNRENEKGFFDDSKFFASSTLNFFPKSKFKFYPKFEPDFFKKPKGKGKCESESESESYFNSYSDFSSYSDSDSDTLEFYLKNPKNMGNLKEMLSFLQEKQEKRLLKRKKRLLKNEFKNELKNKKQKNTESDNLKPCGPSKSIYQIIKESSQELTKESIEKKYEKLINTENKFKTKKQKNTKSNDLKSCDQSKLISQIVKESSQELTDKSTINTEQLKEISHDTKLKNYSISGNEIFCPSCTKKPYNSFKNEKGETFHKCENTCNKYYLNYPVKILNPQEDIVHGEYRCSCGKFHEIPFNKQTRSRIMNCPDYPEEKFYLRIPNNDPNLLLIPVPDEFFFPKTDPKLLEQPLGFNCPNCACVLDQEEIGKKIRCFNPTCKKSFIKFPNSKLTDDNRDVCPLCHCFQYKTTRGGRIRHCLNENCKQKFYIQPKDI